MLYIFFTVRVSKRLDQITSFFVAEILALTENLWAGVDFVEFRRSITVLNIDYNSSL